MLLVKSQSNPDNQWLIPATNVKVEVDHATGKSLVQVNQREKASPFAFTQIGEFQFNANQPTSVVFTNTNTNSHIFIDTVRWLWVGE